MRYLISYDLRKPNKDYEALYKSLAHLKAKKVLDSQWVTNHTGTNAENLRDYIWKSMDSDDGLLVTSLESKDWAGIGLEVTIKSV